jgi:hypothetical protein
MSRFIPGLKLSEAFYRKAVRPIPHRQRPRLKHSAALIGYGSDVLGFDTPMSTEWHSREEHRAEAYELAAEMHNSLRITEPLPASRRQFHGRPFGVILGDRFAGAIRRVIRGREVRRITTTIGSVDQFSDSSDLLDNPVTCRMARALYGSASRTASLTPA